MVMKKIPPRDEAGWNKHGMCKKCGMERTQDGDDPCIANLPGVLYACCGHGVWRGYLKFADGRTLHFHPINMALDSPEHELIRDNPPVPVYIRGEKYRLLNYKTGKVKLKGGGRFSKAQMESARVKLRRRKDK